MTTQIKSKRFRLRRTAPASGTPATADKDARSQSSQLTKQNASDQVQDAELADEDSPASVQQPSSPETPAVRIEKRPKPTAGTAPDQADRSQPETPVGADVEGRPDALNTLDAIRDEGLTARQLRMAMRVAQKYGIRPTSAHEAVLLLRQRGIDPFARSTMLELVQNEGASQSRELAPRPDTAPVVREDASNPVTVAKERMARLSSERDKELRKVQREIAKRRRKRLALLGARLLVFVTLPTFIVTWYFYLIATPMYATESQFIIQQADSAGMGDLGGMLPSAAGMGLGGQNEASSVQSFLQSRSAMLRLDAEEGFKDHFSGENIDLLKRLPEDVSDEAAYRLFKRQVQIGYDPTEGVIRMEVIAASPEDSERFSRALIRYAEEHVDMMTQRLRDSQMTEARQSLEDAQQKLIEARLAVVDLQERSEVLSSEVELSLLSQQIGTLEAELTQTRLSLQEMRSNPRPNPARLQPLERREEALRAQIETLRGSMTRDTSGTASLARTQSQLIMAEAEVQTREMMRAQAMQQLESARLEVSRQVRYLALSVEPVAPDEPTYPRKLENSALAFLIFLGIYLFVSMTGSVLREQISG